MENHITYVLLCFVSFLASTVGTICGIGGGVFMKPLLDVIGRVPLHTVNFLSTCTVISMAGYNVIASSIHSNIDDKKNLIDWNLTTWLAVGSAIGGLLGKYIYSTIYVSSSNPEIISCYQSLALFAALSFTLVYFLNKKKLIGFRLRNPILLCLLGLLLGILSSFVGIGGGPMNLAVLSYFLSMPTKKAAQNSLYMILISQMASLIMTFIKGSIPTSFYPHVQSELWLLLIGMITCSIFGGIIGKKIYHKIPSAIIDKLFLFLTFIIMALCVWNVYNKL